MNETIELKVRLVKPKRCGVCGIKDGKTQHYICGLYSWMHPECAKLAEKVIKDYLSYLKTVNVEELIHLLESCGKR